MTDSDARAKRQPPQQLAGAATSSRPGTTTTTPARAKPVPTPPRTGRRAAGEAEAGSGAANTQAGTKAAAAPNRSRITASGAGAGADAGLAVSAVAALSALTAQLGTNAPSTDTGQPVVAPWIGSDRPTGPMQMDGHLGTGYTAAASGSSLRATAMSDLNAELAQLLGGAADATVGGRTTLAAITADVDAALTALGPIQNTPAGKQLLIDTLDQALQRAGTVLNHGQAGSALTAAKINALAERFQRESGAVNPQSATTVHSGGPPLTRPSGQVGQWIGSALNILAANGYDPRQLDPAAVATIIAHESAGNPNAINNWDSNAAAGHPSKGLMQTIDSTFNAYALPGHQNIWDPVDNIIAGVRYAIHRYGSLDAVPGIAHLHSGQGYVGY
ncbi:transglycosylase SLT domain-containing protein [Nocardia stercoris]|uniref:DUF4226 domain-containing protein n=1 Tax=Nocardia stercoris TaxID=2483361 RepID=A0A3M2L4T5_9NOCA|nr:transglycosylase SLT domain-containing protein [Nocardia stercoris]RMI29538.1 DUF4226 domain-containing protein [Nocardia stercoris]